MWYRRMRLAAAPDTVESLSTSNPREETLTRAWGRMNRSDFRRWLLEYMGGDADEARLAMTSDGDPYNYIEEYLYDRYTIGVADDGDFTFQSLSNPSVSRIIADDPVEVYHHTSSAFMDDTRQRGLVRSNQRPSALNSHSGVYLTTESGGVVPGHYANKKVSHYGGDPIAYAVRTHLHELEADPDDQDIQSGSRQFITPHVAPDRIKNWADFEGRNFSPPYGEYRGPHTEYLDPDYGDEDEDASGHFDEDNERF